MDARWYDCIPVLEEDIDERVVSLCVTRGSNPLQVLIADADGTGDEWPVLLTREHASWLRDRLTAYIDTPQDSPLLKSDHE